MTADRQRARALLEVGRLDQAEAALRSALVEAPGDAELLTLLAYALRRQEKFPQAREACRAALAADPRQASAHLEHAELMLALYSSRDAIAPAEQAIRLEPHDPDGYLVLARALVERRRLPEARAAADHGLRLAPHSVYALLTMADVARAEGNRDEADRFVRAALARDPESPHGRWLLAMLQADRLHVRASVRTLRDVARDNPAQADAQAIAWPVRRLLTVLRHWWPATLLMICAAALLAGYWIPAVHVPARIMAGVDVATVIALWTRLLVPAGRAPWRAMGLSSRVLRRTTYAGIGVAVLQMTVLTAYTMTGLRWLPSIAVALVPVRWMLTGWEVLGAYRQDVPAQMMFSDLRGELRQWWRETRDELREAWKDPQDPARRR
ncbi:hypothetical protein Acsp01_24990 [Actinoplanes sp. NBRC 101535]|nr:hypothetical protein Acsp01_24990 [Actinoplanes sp. NBRC 101535]